MTRLRRPDSRYKVKKFSRDKWRTLTKYRFEAQKDDYVLRCAWPLLAVSRTLRRRFINETFSYHTYVVNLLDLEAFAYLVTTPPLKKEEAQDKAKDEEAPPLPQLTFREISVFVPAGMGLPPLPLQPFFTLAQQGVSVNLMSQEAEERDPAMMATIQSVYDFLTNLAREGSSLPVQYENVHVSYGGDLYLKPSSAYTMKYGAGRIPRTIFPYPTWTPTLQNLLSDVGPLHRLTGSTVWLDMKRNYYNKQHEYPDLSKRYGQSIVEDVKLHGHCVKQNIYKKGLRNHFILENEAFDTSKNDHLIQCVHIPLDSKPFSRRSYTRLFHRADDDIRTHPDEGRTRLYEILNSKGVRHCGWLCREDHVRKVRKKIVKGELTLEELEAVVSSCEEKDAIGEIYWKFCATAKAKAEIESWKKPDGASSKASSRSKEDVREPNPDADDDKEEARASSESESSEEEDDANDSPPPIFIKKRPVVRKPPEGYADIELDACSDTSSLAGDEDDDTDDEEDCMTDTSSVYGYYRGDRTPDVKDSEYDEDRRWNLSEWKQSQELDDETDWETKPVRIPARELAAMKVDDDEKTKVYMQMRIEQLLLEKPPSNC